MLTWPLACQSSPEAETSEQGDSISGLVARLKDVAVRDRWEWKGEGGPTGDLKAWEQDILRNLGTELHFRRSR